MESVGKPLADFTSEEILSLMIDGMKIRKMATADNYLYAYSKFFDFLIKKGAAKRNPCDSAVLDSKSISYALGQTNAEVHRRKDIETLIGELRYNKTLVEVVVRLLYEGYTSTLNDIARIKISDWNGVTLAKRGGDFVPSKRLAAALNKVSSVVVRQGENGKNYKIACDGVHLFPNSVRQYNGEEYYVKRVEASIVALLDIAERQSGKTLDPSTIYYSGMLQKMIDEVGEKEFIRIMNSVGNSEISKLVRKCGYKKVKYDYLKYRYRFYVLRLSEKC
jgi:hypothetical protein